MSKQEKPRITGLSATYVSLSVGDEQDVVLNNTTEEREIIETSKEYVEVKDEIFDVWGIKPTVVFLGEEKIPDEEMEKHFGDKGRIADLEEENRHLRNELNELGKKVDNLIHLTMSTEKLKG